MSALFNSFSDLSVNPNDTGSRQSVLTAAGQVAQSFNVVASGIAQVSSGIATETGSAAMQINQITAQIAALNEQYQTTPNASQDAGLDAQMNAALENLSTFANYSTIKTSDGGTNVFLGGQTAVVLGAQSLQISAEVSPSTTAILDSQGNDITSQLASPASGGSLGALLEEIRRCPAT
jgi:flagellar hook-associated protein 1